ncbi:MAG TPA: protein translocase subunit SecF [Blastocatellia bacterium]|jgi:preprotein translocase subunit SecF|nr:protein translocase subunit SecF [Blastocatellia bacterium]
MVQIFKQTNFDFLGKKWYFIGLSWVLILAGLASVVYRVVDGDPNTHPFNMGVDFSGGTLATVKFRDNPDFGKLRAALAAQKIDPTTISLQPVSDRIGQAPANEVLVRLPNLVHVEQQAGQSAEAAQSKDSADIGKQKILAAIATLNDPSTQGKVDINTKGAEDLRDALRSRAGLDSQRAGDVAQRIVDYREKSSNGLIRNLSEVKNLSGVDPQIGDALEKNFFAGFAAVKSAEAVSPQVGADLRNRAIYVTIVACIGMLIFVAFRFKSWGFGIGAVVAVFHDVLVTLGIFSIMQWELDLTVIAALLTLVGYSMNDTIVIFDRIREMMRTRRREALEKLSNDAINQTLSRTVITSGLTFLTVCAMLAFGGQVLKSFSWCLFIGIIIGTYSSVYIASPFMLLWEGWKANKRKATVSAPLSSEGSVSTSPATAPSVTPQMLAAAGVSTKPRKKGR